MSRLEVADIFRAHGPTFRHQERGHLSLGALKVMSAVESCRSAALGGHALRCSACAQPQIAYNFCRNRHCPKCQGSAAQRWLQARCAERQRIPASGELAALLAQIQALHTSPTAATTSATATSTASTPLETLHLGVGNTVRLVGLADVQYCEATDKYLNVVTTAGEGLIRLSLRELMMRVAPGALMQIHRSIIVNPKHIVSASRDDAGHMTLNLRDSTRTLPVSRAFAHQFKAM